MDWNNNDNVEINASDLGTINAGDYITLTYTNANSAQLSFTGKDSSWSWRGFASESVANGDGTLIIYNTQPMLDNMTNGIVISGINCTLTKVEVTEGAEGDYTNKIWIGNTTLVSGWSKSQSIEKALFVNAQENYILRVNYSITESDPQIGLQYSNGNDWVKLPDTENASLSGSSKDYTITSDMLTALQTYGLIVCGQNYTVTSVEVIPTYSVSITSTNGTIYW